MFTYFDVSEEAEMLKNFALASVATAFANSVLPFPGGPNSNRPAYGKTNSKLQGNKIVDDVTDTKTLA